MLTRLYALSVVNKDNLISKQSFPGCPYAPTHRIASAQRMMGLLVQKTPGPFLPDSVETQGGLESYSRMNPPSTLPWQAALPGSSFLPSSQHLTCSGLTLARKPQVLYYCNCYDGL